MQGFAALSRSAPASRAVNVRDPLNSVSFIGLAKAGGANEATRYYSAAHPIGCAAL